MALQLNIVGLAQGTYYEDLDTILAIICMYVSKRSNTNYNGLHTYKGSCALFQTCA
jgi:hypothetical protein